jgi:hypothetical protein
MTTGQKVVCVDGSFPTWVFRLYQQLPKEGDTYTIRGVSIRREDIHSSDSATTGILLKEIFNPPDPTSRSGDELAFKPERFRPLEEESISVTREHADQIAA